MWYPLGLLDYFVQSSFLNNDEYIKDKFYIHNWYIFVFCFCNANSQFCLNKKRTKKPNACITANVYEYIEIQSLVQKSIKKIYQWRIQTCIGGWVYLGCRNTAGTIGHCNLMHAWNYGTTYCYYQTVHIFIIYTTLLISTIHQCI